MNQKIIISWSGGRDSTLVLNHLLNQNGIEIYSLITTLRKSDEMMSIHYVAGELIAQQAESLGFQLDKILLPDAPKNKEWEASFKNYLRTKSNDIQIAYGDLFLEDIKQYRESLHAHLPIQCIFPIWKRNTARLAHYFIDEGFKAVVTSVNLKVLDSSFAGRKYDKSFIQDLPSNIDPCGENGEFHSFVYDGPIFKHRVPFSQEPMKVEKIDHGSHHFKMAYTKLTTIKSKVQ